MVERPVSLSVPEEAAGTRLDRFLAHSLAGHTRSALQRMIADGRVSVDGRPAGKPGLDLRAGMRVVVDLPPATELPRPEQIPIELLFEDDHLLIVNKSAGLVVHRGHGQPDGTLVNALLGRGTPLAPAGGAVRPGIVHRLDRGTSGALVVAKTDAAYHGLARCFERREVDKRYVALVWGAPDPANGVIERPIGRSRGNPVKMAVDGVRGTSRAARTIYRTRRRLPGFALLEIELETGRTHQIRVHLQSIHHPVVGDDRYGGRLWHGMQDPRKRKVLREFDRLALHAVTLGFVHPVTGRRIDVEAPLPDGLARLLERLGDGA